MFHAGDGRCRGYLRRDGQFGGVACVGVACPVVTHRSNVAPVRDGWAYVCRPVGGRVSKPGVYLDPTIPVEGLSERWVAMITAVPRELGVQTSLFKALSGLSSAELVRSDPDEVLRSVTTAAGVPFLTPTEAVRRTAGPVKRARDFETMLDAVMDIEESFETGVESPSQRTKIDPSALGSPLRTKLRWGPFWRGTGLEQWTPWCSWRLR